MHPGCKVLNRPRPSRNSAVMVAKFFGDNTISMIHHTPQINSHSLYLRVIPKSINNFWRDVVPACVLACPLTSSHGHCTSTVCPSLQCVVRCTEVESKSLRVP